MKSSLLAVLAVLAGLAVAGASTFACSAGSLVSPPGDGGVGDAKTASDAGSTADANAPPPLHSADYAQGCTANNECVSINEGSPCGCVSCGGNAAINVSDQARYQADFKARQALCPVQNVVCPASCAYTETFCSAGKCAICNAPGCGDAGVPKDATAE